MSKGVSCYGALLSVQRGGEIDSDGKAACVEGGWESGWLRVENAVRNAGLNMEGKSKTVFLREM